jgi:molecular chaperone DnaK (HSP70)
LLRNTKKSFTEYGGLLSEVDQGTADTVFKEAEAARSSDKLEEIKMVMNKLERVAGQLTAAMLNPTSEV